MRVGLDGKHQPGMATLAWVREQGLDGASFRSPENFTPTLDEGALAEARASDPAVVGRRIAPYVHMMQAKDAIVYFVEDGLQRQVRPCGEGVVEWAGLLRALGEHCPELNVSIEDHKGLMAIPIFDPAWRA